MSAEHFSVDGTLLEAWASLKSYRPRDEQEPPAGAGGRNAAVDFRGQRRRPQRRPNPVVQQPARV